MHLQEKCNSLRCSALLGEEREEGDVQGNTAGMPRANPVALCPAVRMPCASALTLVDCLSTGRNKLHLPLHSVQGHEAGRTFKTASAAF